LNKIEYDLYLYRYEGTPLIFQTHVSQLGFTSLLDYALINAKCLLLLLLLWHELFCMNNEGMTRMKKGLKSRVVPTKA
jgi:hypothetical protein